MTRPAPPVGYIPTPTSQRIFETLNAARDNGSMVLIVGAPGIGKSQAVSQAAENNTWLIVGSEGCATWRDALLALGKATKAYLPTYNSSLFSSIMDLMHEHTGWGNSSKYQLLVDEAQHFETKALNGLRAFHDALPIALPLVGSDEIYRRFRGRKGAYAQLESRVDDVLRIDANTPEDVTTMLAAWHLHGLNDEATAKCHAVGTGRGGMRALTRLLKKSLGIADEIGEPITSTAIIVAAETASMFGDET